MQPESGAGQGHLGVARFVRPYQGLASQVGERSPWGHGCRPSFLKEVGPEALEDGQIWREREKEEGRVGRASDQGAHPTKVGLEYGPLFLLWRQEAVQGVTKGT